MSDDERLHVLKMVAQGRLTVEEAERLLDILARPGPVHDAAPPVIRLRRAWEIPFLAGVILLALAALCISVVSSPWLMVLAWVALVMAALLIVVGWLSQWSPWLHLHVVPRRGPRIAFSLPLPTHLAAWGIALAHPLIDRLAGREAAGYLALTRSLLEALHDHPSSEPIAIDIDDEDGDAIHIYLG